METERIQNLKICVLADNHAADGLLSEWGLSILIEADGHKILLDGGMSDVFLKNAGTLGIDLSEVETAVLSHAHYDHADGLSEFLNRNRQASVWLRQCCGQNCYRKRKDGSYKYIGMKQGFLTAHEDRLHPVTDAFTEILPGVCLIAHRKKDYKKIAIRGNLYRETESGMQPENFAHEQSLVIRKEDGLVIFNSCSHIGPGNIVEEIQEITGETRILAYIGGLHQFDLPPEEVEKTADELESAGIGRVYTGHCTGEEALELLKRRLGDRIVPFYAGFQECI